MFFCFFVRTESIVYISMRVAQFKQIRTRPFYLFDNAIMRIRIGDPL